MTATLQELDEVLAKVVDKQFDNILDASRVGIDCAIFLRDHAAEIRAALAFAVFNPNEVDVSTLPVIYGFNNGGPERFLMGALVAEDGTVLGSHCCSSEQFMYGDLGILKGSAPSRHETFRKHYPNGYRMEFVPTDKLESHEAFNRAIAIAEKDTTK